MIKFYTNCIPVMGVKNIVFCDLERQRFQIYPKNQLFKNAEINHFRPFKKEEISEQGLIFLKKNQFLITDESVIINQQVRESTFYKWKTPSLITNAVIELSEENELLRPVNFNIMINCLETLLCKQVFLQLKKTVSLDALTQLVHRLHHSNIQSIQLSLIYQNELYSDEFGLLIMTHPKIQFVILEASCFEKNIENRIFYTIRKLEPHHNKKQEHFVTNVALFSESQLHHTYFNRKLYIGSEGEIKNAPECSEMVGKIQQIQHPDQLVELIKTKTFQKYWYVSKARCVVCRVCEFRHVCVDNRVPHQRKNGYWYHLEGCNYDPYTGKWKDE